jgi:hypothetical protein
MTENLIQEINMEDVFRKTIKQLENKRQKNYLYMIGLEKSMVDEPSTYASMHDELDEARAKDKCLEAQIEAVEGLLEAALNE